MVVCAVPLSMRLTGKTKTLCLFVGIQSVCICEAKTVFDVFVIALTQERFRIVSAVHVPH